MSAQWYVVWTRPQQEVRAMENLERQGFAVFYPQQERRVRRAGRASTRVEAMFPRYLFLNADAQQQSLASVRATRGCCDLVRLGGQPATVPGAIVTDVQRRCDADGVFRTTVSWRTGQELEILDGPFQGLKAIYQAATSSERVLVLLHWLGAWQRATVSRAQVMSIT